MKENDEELKELDKMLKQDEALNQSAALNKILLKILKDNKAEMFRLWLALLFMLIFMLFSLIFMQTVNERQQEKFIEEQNKYLDFLKEFDYEVEIVEEGYEYGQEEIGITQENDNGNNVVQTGTGAVYNQ